MRRRRASGVPTRTHDAQFYTQCTAHRVLEVVRTSVATNLKTGRQHATQDQTDLLHRPGARLHSKTDVRRAVPPLCCSFWVVMTDGIAGGHPTTGGCTSAGNAGGSTVSIADSGTARGSSAGCTSAWTAGGATAGSADSGSTAGGGRGGAGGAHASVNRPTHPTACVGPATAAARTAGGLAALPQRTPPAPSGAAAGGDWAVTDARDCISRMAANVGGTPRRRANEHSWGGVLDALAGECDGTLYYPLAD
eukprot:scaffold14485_cov99-Isochrysis_galbana.AAC.3